MSDNSNSYSLLNLDGVTDVVNNLIDKISSAVGWIATHDTPKRIARRQYVDDIQSLDLDPLEKAAKISRASQDIKQYCNQYRAVSSAAGLLTPAARPQDVEDEWINSFMDKVRLISSDELQAIWARILAEECEAPGTVPLQLLHILSILPKHLAEAFQRLCRFAFVFESETHLLIQTSNMEFYNKYGLTFSDIQNLSAIGLITQSDALSPYALFFATVPPYKKQYLINIGKAQFVCEIKNETDTRPKLAIGEVLLTQAGQALCAITESNPPDEFPEFCAKYWRNKDVLVTRLDEAQEAAAVAAND